MNDNTIIIENYLKFPYICNAKCKFCYLGEDVLNKNKIKTCSKDDFDDLFFEKKFLKNIKYKIKFLGGEPTLYKKLFIEFLDYIDKNNLIKDIEYISITTNGLLIKEFLDIKDITKIKNKIEIKLSIHGLFKEHDNFLGVKGAFDNIMNNIMYFKEQGYTIKLNIVASKLNIFSIIEIISFFYKKGFKSFFVLFVDYTSDAYKNRRELFFDFFEKNNIEYYLKIVSFLGKLKKKGCEADIDAMFPVCIFKNTSYYQSILTEQKITKNDVYHIVKTGKYIKRYKGLPFTLNLDNSKFEENVLFDLTKITDIDSFSNLLLINSQNRNYHFYGESKIKPIMCYKCKTSDTCRLVKKSFSDLEGYTHGLKFIGGSYWDIFYDLNKDKGLQKKK